jgi:3-deoxy-D-manno-octulosonic acid kinase
MGWLDDTLARHGTLEAWASGPESVEVGAGRGPTRARAAPLSGLDGSDLWVCRHYRRGGRLAPLLGDRYVRWGSERPFRELEASTQARARGVRTPAIVAGAVYRAGAFYRADLLTEHVPQARSLAHRLREERGAGREGLLRRVGRAVRALEEARVLHADASAGNFLLEPGGTVWVLDLDRCVVLPAGERAPGGAMRLRLERSLRKISALCGAPFGESEWTALRAGYEDVA